MARRDNVTLFNAKILWPNFAGERRTYNKAGDRNFNLSLTPDESNRLRDLGYNVKAGKPSLNDPDDVGEDKLVVKVHYGQSAPRVILVMGEGGPQRNLTENTVYILDELAGEYDNVDLTIRPYDWEVDGQTGRTAYLQSLYVTVDPRASLSLKYLRTEDDD